MQKIYSTKNSELRSMNDWMITLLATKLIVIKTVQKPL